MSMLVRISHFYSYFAHKLQILSWLLALKKSIRIGCGRRSSRKVILYHSYELLLIQVDSKSLGIGADGTSPTRMVSHNIRWVRYISHIQLITVSSIPKMSGIISDKNDSDHGVAQLRNTVLHTFVNSGNAQLFGNVMMKAVLDVWCYIIR